MGKYATYLDLGVSGVEEYKSDLFPLLDPTLQYSLRAVGFTSRRPVLSPSRRIYEPEANTPVLHPTWARWSNWRLKMTTEEDE